MTWNVLDVQRATQVNQQVTQSLMDLLADLDYAARLQVSSCRVCHYFGPRDLTNTPLAVCRMCTINSCPLTAAVLCLECAQKYILCTRCGGDRDLKPRHRFRKLVKNPKVLPHVSSDEEDLVNENLS